MKKNTKGAIAVGAAALLLAGGAGTMAAWSDSASLGGGTVTSGELGITQVGTGAWTWATPGGATGEFNPTTARLVPGDVVTYTGTYALDVVGTNLKASLTPTLGGVTGDLATYLDVNAVSNTAAVDIENITASDDTKQVSITTTITFKPGTTEEASMNKTASLAGSTITLQQTAPAGPA